MTKPGSAGSRHDTGIEHIGQVNNRHSRRPVIREQCNCVATVRALIRRNRVRIIPIDKSSANIARDPIGQQNNAGRRRKGYCRNGVVAKFTRHDAGMGGPLCHRDAA